MYVVAHLDKDSLWQTDKEFLMTQEMDYTNNT